MALSQCSSQKKVKVKQGSINLICRLTHDIAKRKLKSKSILILPQKEWEVKLKTPKAAGKWRCKATNKEN
jgi:hypothetical protein